MVIFEPLHRFKGHHVRQFLCAEKSLGDKLHSPLFSPTKSPLLPATLIFLHSFLSHHSPFLPTHSHPLLISFPPILPLSSLSNPLSSLHSSLHPSSTHSPHSIPLPPTLLTPFLLYPLSSPSHSSSTYSPLPSSSQVLLTWPESGAECSILYATHSPLPTDHHSTH